MWPILVSKEAAKPQELHPNLKIKILSHVFLVFLIGTDLEKSKKEKITYLRPHPFARAQTENKCSMKLLLFLILSLNNVLNMLAIMQVYVDYAWVVVSTDSSPVCSHSLLHPSKYGHSLAHPSNCGHFLLHPSNCSLLLSHPSNCLHFLSQSSKCPPQI